MTTSDVNSAWTFPTSQVDAQTLADAGLQFLGLASIYLNSLGRLFPQTEEETMVLFIEACEIMKERLRHQEKEGRE